MHVQVIDALLCLGAVVDHKPVPAHLLLARQPAVLIVVIIFKGNFNCSFLIVASRASCALGAALLQLCCSSVAAVAASVSTGNGPHTVYTRVDAGSHQHKCTQIPQKKLENRGRK
jgi:hypothetical protein